MNFEHLEYLPWIIIAFSCFVLTLIWLERKFFKIVKLYWFYNRSFFSYISSSLFCLGIGLLMFSLLDLRGPEEKIKSGVPTERTIILIDTSASMLAEDVKPSRLQKAVLVAKHFARKAAGHQMAIVAFAEIQKKIVPFTNDLDLIDARLESIKTLRNQNGSSALSAAIQESIQYFKETGEARGNILVLTDGEETASEIDLNLPKEIHLALVGVGTAQGGRIPLDDGRGFRYGYKKSKGQDVITKLNENFFKKIASDVPSGEYWLANTYNLPSDEIMDFFKGEKQKSEKQQDMVIKPVLMEWIVVPAVILLIVSYFVKSLRMFTLSFFFFLLPVYAAQDDEEAKLTPQIIEKLENLQKGELNQLEKIKLADELHKAGAKSDSLALYEENLPMDRFSPEIPAEAYLNYGTALLEKGEEQKGLAVYETLGSSIDQKTPQGKKIADALQKNTVNYFKVQDEKKEKEKKDQKENKENKDKKDKSEQNQGNSGDPKDQKNQGQQSQDPKDQKDQKGQNSEPKDQKDKENSEKEKKDQESKGQEDKEKDAKDKDKREESSEPEGEKKKIPPPRMTPKLKQLMSDDRQLQMKIIEQGTRDMNRPKNRKNKDW